MSLSLKAIAALSSAFLFIAFFTCNNDAIENDTSTHQKEYSSISIVKGIYKIDTNMAVANWYKEKLFKTLETENLVDKKTVSEIPGFIKAFLDGTTYNNEFDITDPGKEWQEGGWVIGFDKEKKNIAHAISSVAKPFPTRQLIYCGIGKNIALISYYIGGIETKQHNIIIKFENEKIVDLWFDYYYSQFGYSLGGTTNFVTSKTDIMKYIKNTNSGGC
ncbi:MAG: hypothetical protein V4677_12635 [Bacteroidota bacterium]